MPQSFVLVFDLHTNYRLLSVALRRYIIIMPSLQGSSEQTYWNGREIEAAMVYFVPHAVTIRLLVKHQFVGLPAIVRSIERNTPSYMSKGSSTIHVLIHSNIYTEGLRRR